MCKYSIIVPIYNKESYLQQCIESVLNQTYTNWELILINDGSLDSSALICEKYVDGDKRVKYFYWNNHGVVQTRQYGVRMAQGDYIIHLDADDYWNSNLLETVDEVLQRTDCDILQFRFQEVFDGKCVPCKKIVESDTYYDQSQKSVFLDLILSGNGSLVMKVFKRKVLVVEEGYYDRWRHITMDEDVLQMTDPVCRAETMMFINDILYNYRIIGDSMAHTFEKRYIMDVMEVLESQLYILKNYHYDTKERITICYQIFFRNYVKQLKKLFLVDMSKKQKRKIMSDIFGFPLFDQMKEYEKINLLGCYSFMIVKAFRYRQYWIIKTILAAQSIKSVLFRVKQRLLKWIGLEERE